MTEFHTVKRIDNTRLVRPASPARLKDLWRPLGVGVAAAMFLLSYAWQHFEYIQLRYRIEGLQLQRAQATELNQQLSLEVAALRSPMRVDSIARHQLGLTVPVPGQVTPGDGGGPSDAVLAEARNTLQTPRP